MLRLVNNFFKRFFGDPEAAGLALTIVIVLFVYFTVGNILTPVFASLVIAYLLDGLVKRLERWRCPHVVAVNVIFLGFIGLVLIALLWLLPLLWQQLSNFLTELPHMISRSQAYLLELEQRYPDYISVTQLKQVLLEFKAGLGHLGQILLSFSIASISGLLSVVIYLILVPLLVFFFLKDGNQLLRQLAAYLPKRRRLVRQVWNEVNQQIGNYIRGRLLEMVIVGLVTGVVFSIMGLQYAILLSVLVGLAVFIPYVGVVIVTIPVLLMAFWQWGWGMHLGYLVLIYAMITVLDANVLAPLLLSEAVDLHPVVIIIAVLVFGGFWGFWGVFFSVPLASVVKAILHAWPVGRKKRV